VIGSGSFLVIGVIIDENLWKNRESIKSTGAPENPIMENYANI